MIRQAHEAVAGRSIRHLCELLEVNRSWYYVRPAEEKAVAADVELRDAIEQLVLDFPGYRRVTAALHRAGWQANHKRVLRVLREESRHGQLKRHFVPTTDSHHRSQVYPNLLAGRELTAPNQAWVGDITYIRCRAALCTWRVCWMPTRDAAWAGSCPG